jgi:hypothetical protein
MVSIGSIFSYLPPWTSKGRVRGSDEDAVTMAVAPLAARPTPTPTPAASCWCRAIPPLWGGGSGAVRWAGLSLASDTPILELQGGAAAVIDQITLTGPGSSHGPPIENSLSNHRYTA